MKKIITLSLTMIVMIMFSGCADHDRPTDLPKLYPCKITVTQETNPFEGAVVTLISKTSSKYGTCSATTDASGVAELRTYGFDGVPIGRYSVTISKIGVEGAKEAKTQEGVTYETGGKVYAYVDAKYSNEAKPMYEIIVTEKGAKETFDAGTPVHVFLRNNN